MVSIREFDWQEIQGTPFEQMSQEALQRHLDTERYGDFWLSDAVRPAPNNIPNEGYRFDEYRGNNQTIPLIMAAASREKLFPLFLDLTKPVGKIVDIALDSTHSGGKHAITSRAEDCERTIVTSWLYDFEDALVNDGDAGIAVYQCKNRREVFLDEHKILIMYAPSYNDLRPFANILDRAGIREHPDMKFISEGYHVHYSCNEFRDRFQDLGMRLGCEQDK